MKQVQVKIETEDIEIPKEVLEDKRRLLYGKPFDSLILENYYKSQLLSETYQKCLKLDNTLPYVSTHFEYIIRGEFWFYIFNFIFADTNLHTLTNVYFEICRGTENTFAWTENGTHVWIFILNLE